MEVICFFFESFWMEFRAGLDYEDHVVQSFHFIMSKMGFVKTEILPRLLSTCGFQPWLHI